MYELLSLAAGLALGVALLSIESRRTQIAVGAAASVAIGIAIAAIAGELAESPLFALWDAAQCAVAAALVVAAAPRLARRRA